MKTIKEELIDKLIMSMSTVLESEQLSKLLYVSVDVFKDVDMVIAENCTLPSVDLADCDLILKNFLGCKKLKGCTDSTLERYRQVVQRFHDSCQKSYVNVDVNDVRRFLANCMETMNTTSVNGIRLCLNSFFKWMLAEEYIPKNPCELIDKFKCEKRVRQVVTQTDVVKLKDHCISLREVVLIDLLDCSGIRCMEVPTIKISDIDFAKKTIKVYGKGKKERYIAIDDYCVKHIQDYLEERKNNGIEFDYLICRDRGSEKNKNPLSKDTIHEDIKRIRNRAVGVNHVKIHGMRHKFATDMNRRGMNIMAIKDLLGHSSIATTQIYIDTDKDSVLQEYNRCK